MPETGYKQSSTRMRAGPGKSRPRRALFSHALDFDLSNSRVFSQQYVVDFKFESLLISFIDHEDYKKKKRAGQ